ncbi:ABC transporter ATP-binding protein [Arthrobacter jiangjiafuii]|uniref:ABC transporter ATP-binding protein n=1 Tax=Arthrobacter jiangjiafuii TaxID=2817475 RepID=A0A975QZ13_9MICC|nr:ABC transporter ATP-binding protein [Arthrobacter jiangjiafuii]MBP3044561.1 ABC transporter ATP-binding protein [Arthrobacter jiangjiafuii]QWC09335.1 ABC transporter ATP-binding protein [Arthrobacter jiangjiafuii]
MNVIQTRGLTRRYRDQLALDNVTLNLEPNRIYGLLGRNGAGKTTLMSILTAQEFASSGEVRVFGADPFENEHVLSRLCFVRESQKYPDDFTICNALDAAALFFPRWNKDLAQTLLEDFQLPQPKKHRIKKLSRGQLSAVGVIIGLASRAELTFFDEPYLGLDAVARQLFYDRLLTDFAEHPRTVILSSHLIDEVANLLEHVIVIDHGRIVMDDEVDSITGSAFAVAGSSAAVEKFVGGRPVLHRDGLGALASVTVDTPLGDGDRELALALGLELAPVSLQQLVVRRTLRADESYGSPAEDSDKNLEVLQ